MARRTASQVVNQGSFEPALLAGGRPRFLEVADLPPVMVKDLGTVQPARSNSFLNNFPKSAGERQNPRLFVLGVLDSQSILRPPL